jgi:hypothetical protein
VYNVGEPWIGRPGPRLVEGVRALRRIVDELRAARGSAAGSDALRE